MQKDLMTEETIEEQDREAEMQAMADMTAEGTETVEDINEKVPYTVNLSRNYELDGVAVKELDLSGLTDLTTAEAQEIDRVMGKLKHHPQNKFRDTMYTKYIAMKVTGLPVEFFNTLSWKDMEAVTARIAIYFLL